MAGLDSINSGQKSGSGYQPGRDEKPFNPKTAEPFPDAPFAEPDRSGGDQGSNRASGLPGTPFKSKQPNPQDGGGHKKFAGASHEAWSNIPGGGSAGKPKIPGAGRGGPAGAAGKAGGGKAAFAQKAAEGLQQGLNKLQQGDIVGGAKDAVKGAAGAAGDLAADKLFYVMIQWALQTFTLSILIGWNLLLFLPWIIGAITGVKISLQLWQKAVIIAMDAIIVGIILLLLIIFTVTFCYGVSGKEFSLTAFSVNPVGYVAGQAAQYVLPQEVVDFCSSVSGTKAGDFGGGGATDNYGGNGPTTGGGGGPGSGKCENITGNGVTCSAGCDRGDEIKCDHSYDQIINEAATKYNIDPNFIRAIIQQESEWRNGLVSSVGAQGLMQVMPSTWSGTHCTGDPFNPRDNIMCGAKVLAEMRGYLNQKYGLGNNYRYLAGAYNGGYRQWEESQICPGKRAWECPFTSAEKNACKSIKDPKTEMRNYAVSVPRYYQEYTAGACN